jgi:hypothetical protein
MSNNLGNKMQNFSVDFENLNETLNKKAYKYDDVKDKLVKVAFDVVRFFDETDIGGLWKVQKNKEGDVIVALYEEPAIEKSASVKKYWNAILDSSKSNIYITYKNSVISKIASSDLPFPKEELELFAKSITDKINSTPEFQNKVLKEADPQIVSQFPEFSRG